MLALSAVWHQLAEPAGWCLSLLTGWWGHSYKMHRLARQQTHDAGQMALALVAAAERRAAQIEDLMRAYTVEIDDLRRNRWDLIDMMSELQAQAIAARLIVHELDERLGLPARQFTPLPPYPPELRAGAEAADTAEPRADTRSENRPATSAEAGSGLGCRRHCRRHGTGRDGFLCRRRGLLCGRDQSSRDQRRVSSGR